MQVNPANNREQSNKKRMKVGNPCMADMEEYEKKYLLQT